MIKTIKKDKFKPKNYRELKDMFLNEPPEKQDIVFFEEQDVIELTKKMKKS